MKYIVTYIDCEVITRRAEFQSIVHAVNLFSAWSKEIQGEEQEYPNEVIRSTRGEKVVIIEQL
jgi:hypothetical protein